MNDFDDNFGGPADGAYNDPFDLTSIDPMFIAGLVFLAILVVAVCLVGYFLGRQSGLRRVADERKASREAIYGSVRYALDKALKSSGGVILERGREVADILESRVGLVIALNGKLGKAVKALDDALKAEKPAVPAPAGPPKVKVARATEEHYHQVWKALQALNKYWQKDKVLPLLEAAQRELSTPPARVVVAPSFFKRDKAPSVAAAVAGALNDANKAGTTPIPDPLPVKAPDAVDAAPKPEPTPPPPPPPAPPPSGRRKLPAHKRNMLA